MASTSRVSEHVRDARRQAYRDAIATAARQLFEERGFRDVKMSDVASAAGVSKGTLYNYFESKDEIFDELSERSQNEFRSGLEAATQGRESWDRLQAAVQFSALFIADNLRWFRTYSERKECTGEPGAGEAQRADEEARWGFAQELEEALRQIQASGQLRDGFSVEFIASSIGGALEACARAASLGGDTSGLLREGARLVEVFRTGVEPR